LRNETLSHKFEKATERSSFQIYGGVVVLVCKLGAVGGLGAKIYLPFFLHDQKETKNLGFKFLFVRKLLFSNYLQLVANNFNSFLKLDFTSIYQGHDL
jgi:hypothetical protein